MTSRQIILPCLITLTLFPAVIANATTSERVLAVREGKTASINDGARNFTLLKIRGYSVDVRVEDVRHKLKIGETVPLGDATCSVRFQKVSPETRIARFRTDCP